MNNYIYFSIISFFAAIGITGSLIMSWLLIPNANPHLLVIYLLISFLSQIVSIVLFAIGTEVKPTDKEDESARKAVNWPL